MGNKILFVDDEELICKLINRNVKKYFPKYEFLIANNGIEGLNIFKKYNSNLALVIIDKQMPMMSGNKLISIIRKTNNKIPLILSSGDSFLTSEMLELKKKSLLYTLQKPFGFKQISNLVKKYAI